jgi:hypothetical protein
VAAVVVGWAAVLPLNAVLEAVFEVGDVAFTTEGREPFCGGNTLRVWAAAGEASAEQASRRPSVARRLWRVPPVVVVIFIGLPGNRKCLPKRKAMWLTFGCDAVGGG